MMSGIGGWSSCTKTWRKHNRSTADARVKAKDGEELLVAPRAKPNVKLKRAYEAPAKSDGQRVLVDRVWSRGITKEEILIDDWVKDVAPRIALRKRFNHEPPKWNEFKRRYFRGLGKRPDGLKRLLAKSRAGTITLVFGARDVSHNNAVALKEYFEHRAGT